MGVDFSGRFDAGDQVWMGFVFLFHYEPEFFV